MVLGTRSGIHKNKKRYLRHNERRLEVVVLESLHKALHVGRGRNLRSPPAIQEYRVELLVAPRRLVASVHMVRHFLEAHVVDNPCWIALNDAPIALPQRPGPRLMLQRAKRERVGQDNVARLEKLRGSEDAPGSCGSVVAPNFNFYICMVE